MVAKVHIFMLNFPLLALTAAGDLNMHIFIQTKYSYSLHHMTITSLIIHACHTSSVSCC